MLRGLSFGVKFRISGVYRFMLHVFSVFRTFRFRDPGPRLGSRLQA